MVALGLKHTGNSLAHKMKTQKSTMSSGMKFIFFFCGSLSILPCFLPPYVLDLSLVWLYGNDKVAVSISRLQVYFFTARGREQNVFLHSTKSRALLWLEHLILSACLWSNTRVRGIFWIGLYAHPWIIPCGAKGCNGLAWLRLIRAYWSQIQPKLWSCFPIGEWIN